MSPGKDHREIVSLAFPGLESAHLASMADLATAKKCRPSEVVVRQGEPGRCVYIVASGYFDVLVPTQDGKTRGLGVLGRGEMFGELSLLDGGPRSATVIAHTCGDLLRIEREAFASALHQDPSLAVAVLELLSRRIRRLTERWDDLAGLSVAQRLAKQLLLLCTAHAVQIGAGRLRLGVELSQTQLAGLVGAGRESINHHLRLWESEGTLEREGRALIINNPQALRLLTER